MIDIITTVGIAYIVIVITCFVLAEVGPEKHRLTAKWIGVALATLGMGILLLMLERRRNRAKPIPRMRLVPSPDHSETDERRNRIDKEIESIDKDINREPPAVTEDDKGSDMARRLRDE